MHVTPEELNELFLLKYGRHGELGWGPRLRSRFGYFTPDDVYEAVVMKLVTGDTTWLDVGCGRDIFPSNAPAARVLADRCKLLVGLDPSDNIDENPFLHQRVKSTLEDFQSDQPFDLVTMRMVAEHITQPAPAVSTLARVLKPGGRAVVYTVHKWSPISMVSAIVPFRLHHHIKLVFWNTEEKDTFPTAYKMNTRRELMALFCRAGFREEHFMYLDDCRASANFKWLNRIELALWKALHAIELHYPEVCMLAVYQKSD